MTARHPFIRPIWAAWFYLLCIVLMPTILMLNLSSQVSGLVSTLFPGVDLTYPSTLLCKPGNCPQSIPQTNGIVKDQYNNAAKEIQERIKFEHLLFVLKFTASGVIIAFVARRYRYTANATSGRSTPAWVNERALVRSQGAALSCWIAVVVCQTIDLHLQSNIRILSDIGSWVRDCIEPCLIAHPLVGWETYLSAVGPHKGPFSSFLNLERHFFTLVLFTLTVVVFVYLPKKSADVPEVESEALMGIAKVVLPLCVFIFGWTGLYFYAGIRWVNNGYVFMVFVFIALTLWCLNRLSKLKLRSEPQPQGHGSQPESTSA